MPKNQLMMRFLLIVFMTISLFGSAQEASKNIGKLSPVKFQSILDFHVGWNLVGTEQLEDLAINAERTILKQYNSPLLGADLSLGATFRELFFAGVGAGYEHQFAAGSRSSQHNIRAFGHVRLHFSRGKLRPLLGIKGGYQFREYAEIVDVVNEDAKLKYDGLFVSPEVGFSIKLSDHALLNIAIAYELKNLSDRSETSWADNNGTFIETTSSFAKQKDHYLNLILGFTFH